MKKVSLTIDDVQIEADSGMTVLEAAMQHGIYVPKLCYHPLLAPFGGCRLCIVEVQGMPGFPAACTTQVAEGMVVHTASEQVQNLRREILQLLLARHPYTCLVCDRKGDCDSWQGTIRKVGVTTGCQYCPGNGQCELQELVEHLQLEEIELPITYRGLPVRKEAPFFDQDYNLCIVCGRCVRVCQEVRHNGALAFTYRGDEALVGTAFGRSLLESGCEFCGACVDVCPTGALADKIGKWEGVPASTAATICPYCSVGCALNLNLKDGLVIGSRPRDEGPANRGQLCVLGRFAVVEMVHNFKRLTTPLVRNEEGRLVEATWEEALEVVARKFAGYRGDRFALITSAKCTNEDNYVLQKLSRAAMGSNNVDSGSALPHTDGRGGLLRTLPPGNDLTVQEIAGAGCVVVIGSDVCRSHPVAGLQVREAVARGSRLVVVDPRRTELASKADGLTPATGTWLRPRPGSDLWLLAGMLKILLAGQGEGLSALGESLAGLDVREVEKVTGVSQEQLSRALELMADKSPVFLFGSGITHYPTAGESVKAVHNLAKLLAGRVLALVGEGNLVGVYDMGARPDYLPGYLPLADADARAGYERAWGCALSDTPGLSYRQIVRGVADGQVKAMYLVGETPPLAALERLEFLVVQDVLPNAHVEQADVVLPAASFAEVEGTFTNMEGRVQRLSKAIDPPGQAKPDWWIACRIARAMGQEGFDFDHPAQVMAEIAELVPGYGGVAYESLDDDGLLRTVGAGPKDDRLLPLSLAAPPEITSSEYPFALVVERDLFYYRGAALSEQVQGMALIKDERSLGLNPQDAAGLGLVNGDAVVVISEQGRLEATARTTAELPPGMASISANGVKGAGLFAEMLPARKAYAVRIERG
jgi:formate dehydrogenase alpha subunit